jgi:hypothetical protein
VLVTERDTKRFAFKNEVIFLLCTETKAVVLAVPKGEAECAAEGIHFVAYQRAPPPATFSTITDTIIQPTKERNADERANPAGGSDNFHNF